MKYEADFINCVAFGKTAEFISNYFTKGQMIALRGSIQVRNWEDNEGVKRYATEVIVDEVEFAGGKKEEAATEDNFGFVPDNAVDEPLPF